MVRITESVQVDISLHQVINALESFAKDYPIERLAPNQIERIIDAARLMDERLTAHREYEKNLEVINKAMKELSNWETSFPSLWFAPTEFHFPKRYKATEYQEML